MEKDNIEQLLTSTFDDYTVPEFKNSWPGIKSEVFRKQFFKFKLYQFNAYYGIVAVATMITAGLMFFSPLEPEKVLPVPVEVEDVFEVPVAKDTLSSEKRVEEIPEIKEMDTQEVKSVVVQPTHDIEAEERKAEVSIDPVVLTPLDTVEPIAIEKNLESLIEDTLETERKKVIVVEPPVVKRDTVVKVIRERRRR